MWSPNGAEIAYRESGSEAIIRIKAANGAGEVREVKLEGKVVAGVGDWTRDGRFIMNRADGAISSVPAAGGAVPLKPQPLIPAGPGRLGQGRVSADGQWLAYRSNESGRQEVYIAGIDAAKGKWQVSTNGGSEPRWSADGRELAYIDAANSILTVVPVEASAAGIRLGKPQPLFAVPANFDLTADHKRILVSEPPEGRQNSPFVILQGWQQLVK